MGLRSTDDMADNLFWEYKYKSCRRDQIRQKSIKAKIEMEYLNDNSLMRQSQNEDCIHISKDAEQSKSTRHQ